MIADLLDLSNVPCPHRAVVTDGEQRCLVDPEGIIDLLLVCTRKLNVPALLLERPEAD